MWTRFRRWFSSPSNPYSKVIAIGVVLFPVVLWIAYGFYSAQASYSQRFMAMKTQIAALQADLDNRDMLENAMTERMSDLSDQMTVVTGTNKELARIIGINNSKLKGIVERQKENMLRQEQMEKKVNQIHQMDAKVSAVVTQAAVEVKSLQKEENKARQQERDLRKASSNVNYP